MGNLKALTAAAFGITMLAATATTAVAAELRERTSDEPRRALSELTSEGVPPKWFDMRDAPRDVEGGTSGRPAGPGSYKAGPWCNDQCITKGVAYLHGSGVEIVVETSVPAEVFVSVIRDDNGDGEAEFGEFESSPGHVTEFSWVLGGLDPGAKYYVMAAATDAYDNTSYAWGSFTMPS